MCTAPADQRYATTLVCALVYEPKASAGEESASDGSQPSKRKRETDDAADAIDAAQNQGKASDDGDGALSAGSADGNRRRSVSSVRRRYPGKARRAGTPARPTLANTHGIHSTAASAHLAANTDETYFRASMLSPPAPDVLAMCLQQRNSTRVRKLAGARGTACCQWLTSPSHVLNVFGISAGARLREPPRLPALLSPKQRRRDQYTL